MSPRRRIFLVSLFGLALEVALIRWISTEIRIFAYFKNLTLIACFFGLGLGCLHPVGAPPSPANSAVAGLVARLRFWWTFPGLLCLCAAVTIPGRLGYDPYGSLTTVLGHFNEMPIWAVRSAVSLPLSVLAFLLLIALFLWITLLFAPAGQLLGRLMEDDPNPFTAYSINVLGSLAGIGLFTGLSFLNLPPAVWFIAALLPACTLVGEGRERSGALLCTLAIGLLFLATASPLERVYWSPYQKLAVRPLTLRAPDGRAVPAGYLLRVNQTFYQRISSFDRRYLDSNSDLFPEARGTDYLGYNLPYRIVRPAPRVLVVGAGTGNDVAAALRNGASHVDAVEIDPEIVSIGRELHPENPYSDPRVAVRVDDARSFLNNASVFYDLIVFGALDSHALSSSMSNIRLDNYVYTVESFRAARRLLSDAGLLVVVFSAERPFILRRLQGMLREAFGYTPLSFDNAEIRALGPAGGGATFFADSGNTVAQRIESDQRVLDAVRRSPLVLGATDVPLSTDDWPYLYLESRTIPRLYLTVMAALALIALLLVRSFVGALRSLDWHFFLLGAAFLLVEVQGISKMALLFGTTWLVNAIVIGAIMVMILLANAVAPRLERRHLRFAYAGLFASLTLSYLWPAGSLLALSGAAKVLGSGALLTLPVFFAGLIFASTFASAAHAGAALGANLLGALVGGGLESLSFVIGVGALALVALALYAASGVLLMTRR